MESEGGNDWMEEGACFGVVHRSGTNLFLADEDDTSYEAEVKYRKARKYCAQCPVAIDCLLYGMEMGLDGIWGGLTKGERGGVKNLIEKYGYGYFEAIEIAWAKWRRQNLAPGKEIWKDWDV